MKSFFFVTLVILSTSASAQLDQAGMVHPVQSQVEALQQEGQMVSIRLSPGDPLKIYVVGKHAADIDLSQLKLSVRRLSPSPQANLGTRKTAGYYTVSESVPEGSELEVSTQLKDKTEKFHFKVKGKSN